MAIKKYVYAENDADWLDTAAERLEQQGKGTNRISYTDFADSSVNMSITESSYFEVGGSGFYVTGDTAVGGTPATGVCYILATGATATATIAWTTTEPVWRDDLQGYYATIASSVRALGSCYFDGSDYLMKEIIKEHKYSLSCLKEIMLPLIGFTAYCDNEVTYTGANIVFANGITAGRGGKIPVFLPDGAVVLKCEVWGTTIAAGTPDGLIEIDLHRSDNTITKTSMAEFNLTEGNSNASTTSISYATIDIANYCYFVETYAAYTYQQERVYGIQITYLDRTNERA